MRSKCLVVQSLGPKWMQLRKCFVEHWFDNGSEGFVVVVKALFLLKSTNHPTGFITSDFSLCPAFQLEGPFASKNFPMLWWRYQLPGYIVY